MKKGGIFLLSVMIVFLGLFSNNSLAEDIELGITCFDIYGFGCERDAINVTTPGGNPGFIVYADNGHRREISFHNGGMRLINSNSSAPDDRGIDIDEDGWVGINTELATLPAELTVDGSILLEDHASWKSAPGHAGLSAIGGELYGVDENANITLISPHDDVTGEWIFYSKNIKTGRVVRVDMERLVRKIEDLTGEKFMVEQWEEPGEKQVDPGKLRRAVKK
jgi:hypothetical protein